MDNFAFCRLRPLAVAALATLAFSTLAVSCYFNPFREVWAFLGTMWARQLSVWRNLDAALASARIGVFATLAAKCPKRRIDLCKLRKPFKLAFLLPFDGFVSNVNRRVFRSLFAHLFLYHVPHPQRSAEVDAVDLDACCETPATCNHVLLPLVHLLCRHADKVGSRFKVFASDAAIVRHHVRVAKDGSLNISCRATQENFSMMMLFGGTADGEGSVPVMPGKGSKVEATMNLKIDTAELDRLAGIDFSKFDDKGVSEKYADTKLQHRYSDRTLLGEGFMLDDSKITCTSTYKLTIN